LKDNLLVFTGKQFCYFNLNTKAWNIGDVSEKLDTFELLEAAQFGFRTDKPLRILDNASVLYLDDEINWANRVPVVISGGNRHTHTSARVYGLSFSLNTQRAPATVSAAIEVDFPSLPEPRYLHQSAAVKIGGQSYLVVMGGKLSRADNNALSTVYKLRIHDTIRSKKDAKAAMKGKDKDEWTVCKSM